MKKTLQHIKELIKIGEGYHLEFKRFLDKSFAEEVCAFANSSGGKILFGIADDGKLKGNYYIITAETCTRIGDTTMGETLAGHPLDYWFTNNFMYKNKKRGSRLQKKGVASTLLTIGFFL